ncbi:hypothetical protein HK405_008835 [Cladochytrium tenue]|nr:hypothetical protein HK405_008835 [Cladochytrium tenue]
MSTAVDLHLGLAQPRAAAGLAAGGRAFRAVLSPGGDGSLLLVFAEGREPAERRRSLAAAAATPAPARVFRQDNAVAKVRAAGVPATRAAFVAATFAVFDGLQVLWAAFERWGRRADAMRRQQLLAAAGGGGDGQAALARGGPGECPVRREHLQKVSALYRGELKAQVRRLVPDPRAVEAAEPGSTAAAAAAEASETEAMHSVWQLCEVTLLGASSPAPVAEELLLWLNATFPRPTQAEYDALAAADAGGAASVVVAAWERPEFWPYVTSCVLRGHFLAASMALERLPGAATATAAPSTPAGPSTRRTPARAATTAERPSAVGLLVRLMQTMPRPSAFGSMAEFSKRRRDWQAEAAYHADRRRLAAMANEETVDYLLTLFSILAGNQHVILRECQRWAEAVVALLVFTDPLATTRGIAEHVDAVREKIESGEASHLVLWSDERPVDSAMAAAMCLDADGVIQASTRIDWWLVSHLIDLLVKYSRLEEMEGGEPLLADESLQHLHDHVSTADDDAMDGGYSGDSFGVAKRQSRESGARPSLRDWYVLEYGDQLAASRDFWRIGVEYLARAGQSNEARGRLAARLLRAVDPRTNGSRTAKRQVLGLAKVYGLDDVTREVHRVAARGALAAGRLGAAAREAAAAGDAATCGAVAERLLELHLAWSDAGGAAPRPPATRAVEELDEPTVRAHTAFAFLSKLVAFERLATRIPAAVVAAPIPADGGPHVAASDPTVASRYTEPMLADVARREADRPATAGQEPAFDSTTASSTSPAAPPDVAAVRWARRRAAAAAGVELLTRGLAPRRMWARLLRRVAAILDDGDAGEDDAVDRPAGAERADAWDDGDDGDAAHTADVDAVAAAGGPTACRAGGAVLAAAEALELMRCAEELAASHRRSEFLGGGSGCKGGEGDGGGMEVDGAGGAAADGGLQQVRAALVRALARGMLVAR